MSSSLLCGRFELSLERPLIMGIVNVTPDSFSDGAAHFETDAAIAHAHSLIEQGADMLDIGGESTRPGAEPVSEADELKRILPVLKGLADCGVPLSVDTFKPEVMRSEEHTSELQSIMCLSYAVFCLKKKKRLTIPINKTRH